jgi:hypothetical protein
VVKSGDADAAGMLRVAKEGGSLRGELVYKGHGRKVDYNDLGYMRRQNFHEAQLVLEYKTLSPWWKTLETSTALIVRDWETLDFLNVQRIAALNSDWKLANFWEAFAEAFVLLPAYDDREVGDGAALQRAGRSGASFYVSTDPRARVRGELFTAFNVDFGGGGEFYGEIVATLKALPQLDISLMPTAYYTRGEPRYFDNYEGSYLFGDLLAQSFGLTLRATYTFTPRLTLEAYAQTFLASEEYSNQGTHPLRDPRSPPRIEPADLRPVAAEAQADPAYPDPNYESGTFNANVVLRWEYRLGSTLYVVYTHGQEDAFTPLMADGAGLNFKLLKPRPSSDTLLVKLSYWWG